MMAVTALRVTMVSEAGTEALLLGAALSLCRHNHAWLTLLNCRLLLTHKQSYCGSLKIIYCRLKLYPARTVLELELRHQQMHRREGWCLWSLSGRQVSVSQMNPPMTEARLPPKQA